MKNKILPFFIGVLVGAIITAAGFLIYNKVAKKDFNPEMFQMNGRGEMKIPFDGNMQELPQEIIDGNNINN